MPTLEQKLLQKMEDVPERESACYIQITSIVIKFVRKYILIIMSITIINIKTVV